MESKYERIGLADDNSNITQVVADHNINSSVNNDPNVKVIYVVQPNNNNKDSINNVNSNIVSVNTKIPVNHCCHFILTALTMGLWLPFWCCACCDCCCQRPCGC